MLQWAEYEPFSLGEFPAILQPLVRVLVQVGPRRRRAVALVDSGAEASFIPRFLAQEMGCVPPSFDMMATAGAAEFAVGDIMARAHLLLAGAVLPLPLAPFMVPAPGFDLPFVILGHDPLFENFEVRFRGWDARIGFLPRPRPWMEGHHHRATRGVA